MSIPTDHSSMTIPQILAAASQHHSAGRLAEAETLYQEVLKQDDNQPAALHLLGVIAYQSGQNEEAIRLINKAIRVKPNFAEAHNNLGTALQALGRLDESISAYQKALTDNPQFTDAYFNLGTVFAKKGQFSEATACYQKVLGTNPGHAPAHFNLAKALQQENKLDAAISHYQKAIDLQPNHAEAWLNFGIVLSINGAYSEAIAKFKEAIHINPKLLMAHSHLANTYKLAELFKEAIASYQVMLTLAPNIAEIYCEIGTLFKALNQPDSAKSNYQQALSIKPDYIYALNNLGILLRDLGEHEEALEHLNKALLIAPDEIGHNNLGLVYKDLGQLDDAINCYQKAISICPDYEPSHANLAFALLAKGEHKQGLIENEWRLRNPFFTKRTNWFSQPLWDGTSSLADKRLYIWAEQGPQDMTIWSSCLQTVSAQSKQCIVAPPKKLVPLFKRSFPDIDIRAEDWDTPLSPTDFDTHLPMGSLFRYFLEDQLKKAPVEPFLVPDPTRVAFWQKRLSALGSGPFIGISWKSPVITLRRSYNYTNIQDWAPLFLNKSPVFINLQSTAFEDDLDIAKREYGVTIHNFQDLDQYNDLDDVAALASALDLTISVSTAVAAITAGVGTPTWVLSWRQSPWNNILLAPRGPHVRFFQRNTKENWEAVFTAIKNQITHSEF